MVALAAGLAAAANDHESERRREADPGLLERLAVEENTDKQRGMHKFTDVYSSLFDGYRHRIRNFTEVGVLGGGSIRMWLRYFPMAHIYGLDESFRFWRPESNSSKPHGKPAVVPNLSKKAYAHRLSLLRCCDEQLHTPAEAGLAKESMDVILEDAGDHTRRLQERLFAMLWPMVRPGGWYLIEDVDPQRGGLAYTEDHDAIDKTLRNALETNPAFIVDATVGITPERWKEWQANVTNGGRMVGSRKPGPSWVKDRRTHNSHVLVIRKLPARQRAARESILESRHSAYDSERSE